MQPGPGRARAVGAGLLVTLVLSVTPAAGGTTTAEGAASATAGIAIRALSTRADLVTGGDARLAVRLPLGVDPAAVRVAIDGADVTGAFTSRPDEGRLEGVVTGLGSGPAVVRALVDDIAMAQLTLTVHPVGGPLFAGPQVQPWACTTEANGLGPPVDEQCSAAAPVIRWVYRDALTGTFVDYDPASPPPAALVAQTTTQDGTTVPFIVRIERGTLDRSIHDIAVLADPGGDDPAGLWNHKVSYRFGGSCSAQHSQSAPGANLPGDSADVLVDDQPLGLGFAVISSGLNTFGQNCNPVVSAEAVAMLLEHVGDTYGEVVHTIGVGCSAGSIQQHMIAEGYPGLLDGLLPTCSFPDLWSPIHEVQDCALLTAAELSVPAIAANPLARLAVEGSQLGTTCAAWIATFAPVIDPTTSGLDVTACDVGPEAQYDAEDNPDGVRCSAQDYQVAVWGRRAADGFANRPLDNTGVQYGLQALADGVVDAESFVRLNEVIGGYDIDAQPMAGRMRIGEDVARTAYRSGMLVSGHRLADVAIIDQRGSSNAEVHTDYWSWATRSRLEAANGTAGNHVIWTNELSLPGSPASHARAFTTIDAWLDAVAADAQEVPQAQKVIDARPVDVVDGACFVLEQMVTDPDVCAARYPYAGSPRTAAGGPLAMDVWGCALVPLDRDAHPGVFSDAQWARLQAVFPDGVCDWTATPPGWEPGLAWASYTAGPRGASLGPAPVSQPVGQVSRVAGPDRVGTAVAVSQATYDVADTVVLARTDEPADALSGAPLAAALGAPLLLADRDGLPPATAEEITRLGARHVVLLGGTAALGREVEADVEALELPWRRIGGADRYATAAMVAGDLGARDHVLVTAGEGFADALVAGALGATLSAPVLLAGPSSLPAATRAALAGVDRVTIVGGGAAVPQAVESELQGLVDEVERLAGADRHATAAAVARAAIAAGAATDTVWLATGAAFPDAMAVAAVARRAPVLLVDPGQLGPARDVLGAVPVATLRIAGGTAAVPDAILTDLQQSPS